MSILWNPWFLYTVLVVVVFFSILSLEVVGYNTKEVTWTHAVGVFITSMVPIFNVVMLVITAEDVVWVDYSRRRREAKSESDARIMPYEQAWEDRFNGLHGLQILRRNAPIKTFDVEIFVPKEKSDGAKVYILNGADIENPELTEKLRGGYVREKA